MPSSSIPNVLSRHAEEAAFLWLLRDRAVDLPHYGPRQLAELDGRLEAHLDGLRIAGEDGWQRAWKEFEDFPQAGEAFVAANLAFESGDPVRILGLLDAVADKRKPGRAIASAVGWLPHSAAEATLPLLQNWGTPAALAMAIAGAAVRRMPISAKVIQGGLRDSFTRGRTITAVGELAESNFLPGIQEFLSSKDLATKADAAWAVARLSTDRQAVEELKDIAMMESWYRQRSAAMVVRKLEPSAARRWVEMLGQIPGCERVTLQAVAALGDPALVPLALEKLDVPELARLAGETVSFVTGVHLAAEKLDAPPKDGFEAGPTDDPNDPRVDLDPDDGLDWPHPAKLRKWWNANQGRFPKGVRHLCGKPIQPEHLKGILQNGLQRQRAAAALELAVLRPHETMVEVRAPSWKT